MKNKIDNFLKYFTPIILIMILFRTCGIGSEQKRIKNDINQLKENFVNKEEFNKSLSELMWRWLELEEMSDKNKIPINQLKNERKTNLDIE